MTVCCGVVSGCAAQHIELRRQREGYVGIIDTCTSPAQIARAAASVTL